MYGWRTYDLFQRVRTQDDRLLVTQTGNANNVVLAVAVCSININNRNFVPIAPIGRKGIYPTYPMPTRNLVHIDAYLCLHGARIIRSKTRKLSLR